MKNIEIKIAKNGSKRYYVREENGKLTAISRDKAIEIQAGNDSQIMANIFEQFQALEDIKDAQFVAHAKIETIKPDDTRLALFHSLTFGEAKKFIDLIKENFADRVVAVSIAAVSNTSVNLLESNETANTEIEQGDGEPTAITKVETKMKTTLTTKATKGGASYNCYIDGKRVSRAIAEKFAQEEAAQVILGIFEDFEASSGIGSTEGYTGNFTVKFHGTFRPENPSPYEFCFKRETRIVRSYATRSDAVAAVSFFAERYGGKNFDRDNALCITEFNGISHKTIAYITSFDDLHSFLAEDETCPPPVDKDAAENVNTVEKSFITISVEPSLCYDLEQEVFDELAFELEEILCGASFRCSPEFGICATVPVGTLAVDSITELLESYGLHYSRYIFSREVEVEPTAPTEPPIDDTPEIDAKTIYERVREVRSCGIKQATAKNGRHMWYISGRLVGKEEIAQRLALDGFTPEEFIEAEKIADDYWWNVDFPRREKNRRQAELNDVDDAQSISTPIIETVEITKDGNEFRRFTVNNETVTYFNGELNFIKSDTYHASLAAYRNQYVVEVPDGRWKKFKRLDVDEFHQIMSERGACSIDNTADVDEYQPPIEHVEIIYALQCTWHNPHDFTIDGNLNDSALHEDQNAHQDTAESKPLVDKKPKWTRIRPRRKILRLMYIRQLKEARL